MDPKIVLIDGNSLAYRAFYALPASMKTSSGIYTNAVYGFTTMLLKVLEEKPDCIAISFDKPTPTFRHKEYKEYKATREKAPTTLTEQMPWVREIAKAFSIPIYEIEGYEADDLIATIAKKAEKEGFFVEIVTGDLDAVQLISPKVKVLTTRRGITDTVLYDEKQVMKRYGLKPSQIADFKGLKGDPSDNIPGVPGVGDKTASQLLKEYGSLEKVIDNADKIKSPKIREAVKTHAQQARLSKRLATLVREVPIKIDLLKCRFTELDWKKLIPLFEKLEFKTLIQRYAQEQPSLFEKIKEKKTSLKPSKAEYKTITQEKDLDSLINDLKKHSPFAVDCETTSVNPFQAELVGISISFEPYKAYYIPVGHLEGKQLPKHIVLEKLKPFLESPQIPKYGQNIKYDMEVLWFNGIKLKNIAFDTMVAAYLLNPTEPTQQQYNLKYLSKQYLKQEMVFLEDLIGKKSKYSTMAEVPIPIASDYACHDADATYRLVEKLSRELKEKELFELFTRIEVPLISVLVEMELAGVKIDTQKLSQMSKYMDREIKQLEKDIYVICGEEFNINSPKQLSKILFEKLKLPGKKRTKTGISTSAEVLSGLAPKFEIARLLLKYRELSKLKSTYIDVFPELIQARTGRLHSSFNQTMTATGRLSSSDPNLQNIPIRGELGRKVREAFVPEKPDWYILAADYSQIELRIVAHLSEDESLVKAFEEDKDIHTITAAEVFGLSPDKVTPQMRGAAKAVNFGIIYGISEFGLAKNLGISRTQARDYIENYFESHLGVRTYIEGLLQEARKDGFVTTLMGRRRYIPEIWSPNRTIREGAERIAINTPVQGTAADVIKLAMIRIHNLVNEKNLKTNLILQIHDELVFEVPPEELQEVKKMVEKEMAEAIPLKVPVKVDIGIGKSWGEAK